MTAGRTEQDGTAQGCGSLPPVPLIVCVKFTMRSPNPSKANGHQASNVSPREMAADPVAARTRSASGIDVEQEVKGQNDLLETDGIQPLLPRLQEGSWTLTGTFISILLDFFPRPVSNLRRLRDLRRSCCVQGAAEETHSTAVIPSPMTVYVEQRNTGG